jgi:DNA-binding MarR family transcriptional regulator
MTIKDILKTDNLTIEKETILNIMYTQNVLNDRFSEILKTYDLSSEQFNVLRILRGQKGNPANMCVIQERMIAKTSNTTRLVDKLLIKGLVTREVCPQNRRKMEVMITGKGLNLLSDLDPLITAHEKQHAAQLSLGELETLNLLLDRFRTIT